MFSKLSIPLAMMVFSQADMVAGARRARTDDHRRHDQRGGDGDGRPPKCPDKSSEDLFKFFDVDEHDGFISHEELVRFESHHHDPEIFDGANQIFENKMVNKKLDCPTFAEDLQFWGKFLQVDHSVVQDVGGEKSQFRGLMLQKLFDPDFDPLAGTNWSEPDGESASCPDWRTINAMCNNVGQPQWGNAGEVMPRSVTESTTSAGKAADIYDPTRWTTYGGLGGQIEFPEDSGTWVSCEGDPTGTGIPDNGIRVSNTGPSSTWGGFDPREMSNQACQDSAIGGAAATAGAISVDDDDNDRGSTVPNDNTFGVIQRGDSVITYAQVMDHELDATGPKSYFGVDAAGDTDLSSSSNAGSASDGGCNYAFGNSATVAGKLGRTNDVAKNGITSYVDAGIVYGEDDNERYRLRSVGGDGLKHTCLESSDLTGTCTFGSQYLPVSEQICPRFELTELVVVPGGGPPEPAKVCDPDLEFFMANPTKRGCFYAGDFRANENPALVAYHTLFMRMHNYFDNDFGIGITCNSFDGEVSGSSTCKFETIRHRVGYEEQFITYDEWLPAYTGTWSGGYYFEDTTGTNALTFTSGATGVGGMPAYSGYDTAIRGEVRHIFATATFRQHTGVNHTMKLAAGGQLELDQTYFESCVWTGNTGPGCDSQTILNVTPTDTDTTTHGIQNLCDILAGQSTQEAKRGDTIMVTEERNQLMYKAKAFGNDTPDEGNGTFEGYGGDLASLNMFRGRDHNISGYKRAFNAYFTAQWRLTATPSQIHTYDGLGANGVAGSVDLSNAYGTNMDAVDLWTGALGEAKLGNGDANGVSTGTSMLGAILTFDVVTQFRDLRDGDRFFYQNVNTVNNDGIDTYEAPAWTGPFTPKGLSVWTTLLTDAVFDGTSHAFAKQTVTCDNADVTYGQTQAHDLWTLRLECGSGGTYS